MKSSPKIIAIAVMILIFSVTVAAAAGSDSFDGFGVTLAELFSWDKPLAGDNAIETDSDCAETDTDCRETDTDCESWTDAPPYYVSGMCGDNLHWSLDTGEKVLRISGTGAMYDYSPIKEAPWYEHRRYIKSIEIENGATSIGSYAFEDCPNLRNVTVPEGIKSIGAYSFIHCKVLSGIKIPDSVTSLGNRAFYGCTDLMMVEIGSGIKKIEEYTFFECEYMQSLMLSEGLEEIGDYAFSYCRILPSLTIPDSVKTIGYAAFDNCHSVRNIKLSENLETIGDYAFNQCTWLEEIVIPDKVTRIGENAFAYCEGLTRVTIGDSVENIGDSAFQFCDNLSTVTFGNNVKNIGIFAFNACNNLTNIVLSDNIKTIDSFAFSSCDNLKSVIIPDGCVSVEFGAFIHCPSLRYVHIPKSAISISSNIVNNTFAVICSNAEDCYAKEYADAYGIEFFVCGEEHTPMPDNIEKYRCETCDKNFWDVNSYKNHMNSYHYYCEHCGLGFYDYDSYKNHKKDGDMAETDSDADIDINNPTDGETLPGVQLPDALKPTQPTTAVAWYYCSYCDKGFSSSSSLSNHINIYHCATETPGSDTENTNICPYCGTMFDSSEAVYEHKANCSKRPKKICPYCNITFVDETIYDNHINNCTTENKYADMSFKEIIDNIIVVLESENGQWNDIESIITKLIDLYHNGASALSEAEAKGLVADLEGILGDTELLAVFKERLNDLYSGDIQVSTTTTPAYICDYCGLRFDTKEQLNHHVSICGKGNGQGISVKIKTPSVSSVSYGDGIILHAEVSPLPEGMKYEWRASNTCFDMTVSDGGAFCTVTPRENGSTVFSIVVTDSEDNVVCESEPVVLKAKASIFDRIIAFFKNLFGLTKILPEMMK